jgi:hypothetical protein
MAVAPAELARAATAEEQVACLLEADGQEREAAVHRVSAASCYDKLGKYTHAVTLPRAALSAALPEDYRARVEQQLTRCLAGAQKELNRSSRRAASRPSSAVRQEPGIAPRQGLVQPAQLAGQAEQVPTRARALQHEDARQVAPQRRHAGTHDVGRAVLGAEHQGVARPGAGAAVGERQPPAQAGTQVERDERLAQPWVALQERQLPQRQPARAQPDDGALGEVHISRAAFAEL